MKTTWVFVIGVVIGSSTLVRAENRYLEQARVAADRFEPEKALALAEKALATSEPAEQVAIYELLTVLYAGFDRGDDTVRAFGEILSREPGYDLPTESSPKLRELLVRARSERAMVPPQPKREEPVSEPEEHDDDSVLTSWWFWTAVGVVVAGSAGVLVWGSLDDSGREPHLGPHIMR